MTHKLLQEFPTIIETERLVIRKYLKGDGKKFFDIFERNNNREVLREAVDEAETLKTEEDAEINIRQHAAEWEERKRLVMGIWLKENYLAIGQIWIEPKDWDIPSFELGYFLDAGFHGQGYATEAAKASTKFLFEGLHAHKVIIITRDTNARSMKVAERLGFPKEGHHREHRFEDGNRWGLVYYGMLKSEFSQEMS
jgi:ribosomal-protein-alanine N-acetyltransferase